MNTDLPLLVAGIVFGALVYFTLVGVTWAIRPLWCRDDEFLTVFVAVPMALCWPVTLPMIVGAWLVRLWTRPKLPRAEVHRG